MSDYERIKGKIRKIDLQGLSVEEYAKRIVEEKGLASEVGQGPYFYETNIEFLKWGDDWEEGQYVTIDDELYLIYDTCDLDPSSDYINVTPIGNDTYEFDTSFYNGGTYLTEMIEDGIKRLKRKKS